MDNFAHYYVYKIIAMFQCSLCLYSLIQCIPWYEHTTIYSLILWDGHLGCFQYWATRNNVVMNILHHDTQCTAIHIFQACDHSWVTAHAYCLFCSALVDTVQIIYQSKCNDSSSLQSVKKIPVVPHPHLACIVNVIKFQSFFECAVISHSSFLFLVSK